MLPSVNYHLWKACNMRCKFCFATFQDIPNSVLPKGHLPQQKAIELVKLLAAHPDIKKITFAGGEPTLCPWLPELIQTAKAAGLKTMIVTNGSRLSEPYLESLKPALDWIAISIDSLVPYTNGQSGRVAAGARAMNEQDYRAIVTRVRNAGFRLKINTVASAWNYDQNLARFISWAKPERWKILQALPVEGQNDDAKHGFTITGSEFESFIALNQAAASHTQIIAESNELITGSYLMVDPAGRFFDDTAGSHCYSRPILDVGIEAACRQVTLNRQRFLERGGIYDF